MPDPNTPSAVEQYYQEWTDRYVESFGAYFQALQTTNPDDFMDYVAGIANIHDGMKLLDAGCGVCGPAIGLAKKRRVAIEAVTLSETQVAYGEKNVLAQPLAGTVHVRRGDFHHSDRMFPSGHFDVVYFLESLCHSDDPERAILATREVLKPKGVLYIKDLFEGPRDPKAPGYVEYAIEATNRQFCLKTRPMGDILSLLTKHGFRIDCCQTPRVKQDFDKGNAFTARYLFKLLQDQEGPWVDEGFIFLHWMEIVAVKHY